MHVHEYACAVETPNVKLHDYECECAVRTPNWLLHDYECAFKTPNVRLKFSNVPFFPDNMAIPKFCIALNFSNI